MKMKVIMKSGHSIILTDDRDIKWSQSIRTFEGGSRRLADGSLINVASIEIIQPVDDTVEVPKESFKKILRGSAMNGKAEATLQER